MKMDDDIEAMELVHDNFGDQQNARDDNRPHVEILCDRRSEYVCQPMVEL